MVLTRFEALGLLPASATQFDLFAKLPVPHGKRIRCQFKKYKTLSLEELIAQFDKAPVNLIYLRNTKRPYLKFQDGTYVKVGKLQLRKFVLANPTGFFQVD